VNLVLARGVNVAIARSFNDYGSGLRIDDRRVLPDLARVVLAGRDIVLLSDGSATHTNCYVADAVDGYHRVRGRPGEPHSIGTACPEISMRSLSTGWQPSVGS
jgi:UDP-glucuronate decarboxylase